MFAHDLFLQNQVSKQNWHTDISSAPEGFYLYIIDIRISPRCLATTYQGAKMIRLWLYAPTTPYAQYSNL